jgi:hypothetical protein
MNPDKIISALADVGVQATWLQRLDGTEDQSKPLLHVPPRPLIGRSPPRSASQQSWN